MGNDRRKKKMKQSSSRRKTMGNSCSLPNKAIGCMSGLLQLLSRQHSRRRIPSAARKESIAPLQTTPTPALPQPDFTKVKTIWTATNEDARNSGCYCDLARRSPTLLLEIRRSGCCFDHRDSPRRPSALLARLMGMQERTSPPPTPAVGLSVDSAEEKRRTLLGDLERCDEDLRVLKGIIDAIRTMEMHRLKAAGEPSSHEMKCLDGNRELPSPVSVLDALWSPKSSTIENASAALVARPLFPVFSGVVQKKAWSSVVVRFPLNRRMTTEGIPRLPAEHKGVKDHTGPAVSSAKEFGGGLWQWRWRGSHTMVDIVDEVREEAMFEEEGARIIVELADDVALNLVNSLVMELVQVECCSKLWLQRLGCKRKLYL